MNPKVTVGSCQAYLRECVRTYEYVLVSKCVHMCTLICVRVWMCIYIFTIYICIEIARVSTCKYIIYAHIYILMCAGIEKERACACVCVCVNEYVCV